MKKKIPTMGGRSVKQAGMSEKMYNTGDTLCKHIREKSEGEKGGGMGVKTNPMSHFCIVTNQMPQNSRSCGTKG